MMMADDDDDDIFEKVLSFLRASPATPTTTGSVELPLTRWGLHPTQLLPPSFC